MDSNSTDQAAAVAEVEAYISELDFDAVQNYCIACVIALLLYHHITTFNAEVAYFWEKAVAHKGRVTFAWLLFFANRYLPLVVYIYQTPGWTMSKIPWVSTTQCTATVTSQYILEYSQYALWAAISGFRVYSLGGHRLLTCFVLLLALVPVFADITLFFYLHPEIDPVDGCVLAVSSRLKFGLYEMCVYCEYSVLTALSYTGWVLSEAIVVAVTLAATRHHSSLTGALGHGRRSISGILFKNELYHHRTITLLNIAQMIGNLLSLLRPSTTIDYMSAAMTFTAPLTSILLTHFYFDLQAAVNPQPLRVGVSFDSAGLYDASPTAYQHSFGIRTADLEVMFAACSGENGSEVAPGVSERGDMQGSDLANRDNMGGDMSFP
ncbi:hypothetical protein BC628DRAFT_1334324 [Trametes gibbosa]|nr:hypothetical protein BC628DRAFT_1334324 [Trametes gibbosa]